MDRLLEACRTYGDFLEMLGYRPCRAYPVQHDLRVWKIRARLGDRRTTVEWQAHQFGTPGIRVARAVSPERRTNGFKGRDHRKGVGRTSRDRQRCRQQSQITTPGARR